MLPERRVFICDNDDPLLDPQVSQPPTLWRASFGPFTLTPSQRLLERGGAPVRLGGRALDLLIALVESAGETVGKQDLMVRVWPNVVVDEGSLRFHMVAVRKALGDGVGGKRYIVNTANKGYTFVADVKRSSVDPQVRPPANQAGNLPALASTIVGREAEIDALATTLLQRRLVSVVGSGGIGKTTVAIASAQAAAKSFEGDVHFVDLSSISAIELVCSSVARVVGLQNRLDDLTALAGHLVDRTALLVLDCCEHVIGGAAQLAEVLLHSCPRVHILATTREPLRAEGEYVYRLQPLAFPADGEGVTAEAALSYPAVKLFVERAAASASGFVLSDRDAPLASRLCRELDGIALAIELAAGRIEALGLKAITSHFDANVKLIWHGRRTAVPRHQTLSATLDWSYKLLDEDEKRLLVRLSVFAGTFSLDAAIGVCCYDIETSFAVEVLAGLVSKSLLNVDAGGSTLRYGLLDTTKAYVSQKLQSSGEGETVSRRFAAHFYNLAQQSADQRITRETIDLLTPELPNLRASLEWYFRCGEQPSDAVKFAASLCPFLLQLSQLTECSRWAQAALSILPPELVGSKFEAWLQVHSALGQSLMFKEGDRTDAAKAFRRAIEVAEGLPDHRTTLHLLNGYAVFHTREGRFTEAVTVARKAQSLLRSLHDPESQTIVDSLMGAALHLAGHISEAAQYLDRATAITASPLDGSTSKLGFDHHIRSMCCQARGLWLTGQYSKAVEFAQATISRARDSDHAVTYCLALIWAGSVYAWQGDVERLSESLDVLEKVAKRHSFTPYLGIVHATRGQIMIGEGHTSKGIEQIRSAIELLHASRYEMVTTVFMTVMARGLSELSLHSASLEMCDETARLIETGGDFLRLPDLLTVRGSVLAAAGRRHEAADSYNAAIEFARSQGVKSGQVKAAVALATLWMADGRTEEACRMLRSHVDAAGSETSPELSAARALLR